MMSEAAWSGFTREFSTDPPPTVPDYPTRNTRPHRRTGRHAPADARQGTGRKSRASRRADLRIETQHGHRQRKTAPVRLRPPVDPQAPTASKPAPKVRRRGGEASARRGLEQMPDHEDDTSAGRLLNVPIPFYAQVMGRHRLDTISAFARHGYWVRIICKTCDRRVERQPIALMQVLNSRGSIPSIETLEDRMRCEQCGGRGATLLACEPSA